MLKLHNHLMHSGSEIFDLNTFLVGSSFVAFLVIFLEQIYQTQFLAKDFLNQWMLNIYTILTLILIHLRTSLLIFSLVRGLLIGKRLILYITSYLEELKERNLRPLSYY